MKSFYSGLRLFGVAAIISFSVLSSASGQVNVLTQHNDIARTGQNTNETILTPTTVNAANFGKLFSLAVDGQVYAQPLYLSSLTMPNAGVHNVIFVATMHDSVYAFDADSSGSPLWQVSLLDSAHGAASGATTDPISDTGCTLTEGTELGINSTPVIDAGNGVLYVVSRTVENGYPVQRLHALDIKTGLEKLTPVTLSASIAGSGAGSVNGTVAFDPKWENQRAGLLLVNGIVYVAFGSYCEHATAHGWILAYNASTLSQTSAFITSPNASGSGIWMSGAGLAADVPASSPYGRLFVATGNGIYDATAPYTTNKADYGDDLLQLDLANGVMTVTDAFTPMDQATLQANLMDFGSGGVLLLPDQSLTGHTHQMLAGGKNGNIYLVDRDSLGGYSTTANNIIESIVPNQVGGIYGAPAYWNNHVYYWGNNDTLKQFNFTNGLMNFWHSANSSEQQSFPGSSPSISANGTTNGIVWNVDASAWVSGGNANLTAHDAQNVGTTLYSSASNATRDNPGPALKFSVPTIANGKVFVATSGQVSVFGLLNPPDFSLAAAQNNAVVADGGSVSDVISIGAINNFSATPLFSASGLPAGLTATFTGSSASSTTLLLSAASATAAGNYTVVVTATTGTLTHNVPISVSVTAAGAPAPSFSLTAGPQQVSVVQGLTGTTNIAVVALNGFNSTVTLTASGMPTGVTATFSAAVSGVSTLTLTSSTSTVAGIYPITIQASGGGVVSSTTITLLENTLGQTNVLTQHNDISRTGQNINETTLTPANVSSGNFGKLFSVTVDGQVYAQPLYVANVALANGTTHNVAYVATMHDSVYAFDADTQGAPLWQISLLDGAHGAASGATTDPETDTGCTQIAGNEIGITGTPVIDPASGTIYVVGKTFENGGPIWRLHGLDMTTGAERVTPMTISASVAGSGSGSVNGILSFNSKWENQRAGLLLVNGIVYVAFGNYCENALSHGWILAYNASTLQQTSAFVTSPNASGSGIWMSGTGLAADIPAGKPFGRLFVATGNGTYDAIKPYATNTADYGDDLVQLDLTNGLMTVTDAFTPMDQANLQSTGSDFGSGGVMLLPDQTLAGHPHQMLAGGKNGNIYLVDRDSLGGYSTTANNIIEPIVPNQVGGIWGSPAYWNNNVYYWGNGDSLTQFNFTDGLMNAWHSANSSEKQTFPGSTPSISANGIMNAIVWNIDPSAWQTNGNAVLIAHDAQNVATTLYSSASNSARDNPGQAMKFGVPTISNGKVYVATSGQLSVYGLLTAPDFTLTPATTTVNVPQGGTGSDKISVGALNGFSGALTLSASGLPSGMTAAFSSDPVSGAKTISFSATTQTAMGTYSVSITGISGAQTHSTTISVSVTASTVLVPSFSVNAAPQTITIVQGQTGTTSIAVVPVNGFSSTVTLTALNLPAGVTATFGAPVGNISTLTLTTAGTTAAGIYPVTIQAAGGGVTNTATLTLVENNVGQANVLTQHNDIGRTGQNTNETILTPANVSGGGFGKLFSVNVDGQVYAQPLYFGNVNIPNAGTRNVVFVATMHDSLYAFDADSGTLLWQVTLLDAAHGAASGATTDPQTDTGCNELVGSELGITSTPVIDPASGTIYLVGKTLENGYPVMRLHALDVTTGAEKVAPMTLSAAVAGTGTGSSNGILTFDPKWENQRTGLLLVNGIIYLGFASYCDNGPYHGWVLAYNSTTLTQTSIFTPSPNGSGSGIWMSGTGLAADIPAGSPFGRMFFTIGNGTFDATTPYTTNQADYSDDVLQMDLTNGVMTVTDQFTPMDQANLAVNDLDLSSGGLVLLPDQPLSGHPHQMLAAGKTGVIYVIDRDSLGGYSTAANNIIKTITPHQVGGIFSVPAYWNGHAYYWGISDYLDQFNFNAGLINSYHTNSSTEKITFPGSTPAISSNGTSNGIVWDIDASAYASNGNENLIAHDATNVATTLYTSATNPARDNPGPAMKFQVPTISNGKVYVAGNGQLSVFGLLSTAPDFTLTATQTNLNLVVGGSVGDTISVNVLNGLSGTVTLSASALPAGITATFQAGTVAGTSTLTLAADNTTAAGAYQVVVTGTSGSLTHSVTLTVTVAASAVPSFSLKAAGGPVSIVQGQSVMVNITVTPVNGFNAAITLAASNLPVGVSAAFSPIVNNVSVLTLAAASDATISTTTVLVSGTAGSTVADTSIRTAVVAPTPSFTLTAAPSSVTIVPGQAGTSTITVVPVNGFNAAVSFAASGLPTGVTAGFSGSALTLTAAGNAAPGAATITVTGTSGSVTATTTVSLTVTSSPSFTLSASPSALTVTAGQSTSTTITQTALNGFNATVTLSASGLPTGVTATFNASTLTLTAASNATPGPSTITVTGTSGTLTATTTVGLTVTGAPSFTLSASPSSLTVTPGQSTNSTIAQTAVNGFNAAVTLSASGLPAGVTATFNASTLTLTAASNAALGNAKITITGTSGTLTATTTVSLTVTGAPSFTLSASPSSVSMVQGQSATSSIVIAPVNGFNSAVALSAAGLPTGVSATFNGSTLTVTAASNAAIGSATITVTGTSGSLTAKTGVAVTVTAVPTFTLKAAASSVTVTQGKTGSAAVSITPVNGFTGAVTFSVSGLPAGVTGNFSPASSTTGSTLTLSAATSAAAGSYTLSISGVSGSVTASTSITLVVTAAPDFSVALSSTQITLTRSLFGYSSTTDKVTIAPFNGFTGAVNLTVSGVPTNFSATFSPTSVTTSGTSTLTLKPSIGLAKGTYTLTVTGTSGSIVHSATLKVVAQ